MTENTFLVCVILKSNIVSLKSVEINHRVWVSSNQYCPGFSFQYLAEFCRALPTLTVTVVSKLSNVGSSILWLALYRFSWKHVTTRHLEAPCCPFQILSKRRAVSLRALYTFVQKGDGINDNMGSSGSPMAQQAWECERWLPAGYQIF